LNIHSKWGSYGLENLKAGKAPKATEGMEKVMQKEI